MSKSTGTTSASTSNSLIIKLPIGRQAAAQLAARPTVSTESQANLSVSPASSLRSVHTADVCKMQNQAYNTPGPRRSARIATASFMESTSVVHTVQTGPADRDQPHTIPASQPEPTITDLLGRLPLDFTEEDIRAAEDAVLATGAYVYLDDVVEYYRDVEARNDVAFILTGMAQSK